MQKSDTLHKTSAIFQQKGLDRRGLIYEMKIFLWIFAKLHSDNLQSRRILIYYFLRMNANAKICVKYTTSWSWQIFFCYWWAKLSWLLECYFLIIIKKDGALIGLHHQEQKLFSSKTFIAESFLWSRISSFFYSKYSKLFMLK